MYRIAKRVVRSNQELKYIDYTSTNTYDYNGAIIDVTSYVAQGDTINTRDGSKIKLRGMKVTAEFIGNQNSGFLDQNIRFLVVRGHAENNTAMTVGTVLQATGSAQILISPYYFQTSKRYKIIDDKRFYMASGYSALATPAPAPYRPRQYYSRFYKFSHDVTYLTTGTNIMDGGVYIIACSDEANSIYNPGMYFTVRLYFTDS